jgi:hypothetical protein
MRFRAMMRWKAAPSEKRQLSPRDKAELPIVPEHENVMRFMGLEGMANKGLGIEDKG